MRVWLAIALVLLGCTPPEGAAWMPELVVRGRLVERTSFDRHRWDWQVHGALGWRMGAAAHVAWDEPRRPIGGLEAPPCVVEARLCAWERRARQRAYREALRELEGEGP